MTIGPVPGQDGRERGEVYRNAGREIPGEAAAAVPLPSRVREPAHPARPPPADYQGSVAGERWGEGTRHRLPYPRTHQDPP